MVVGEPLGERQLATDAAGGPDVVTVGRVQFYIIDREGRLGARVKDPEAPTRMLGSEAGRELARALDPITRALGLNEDLTEAIALAHDLGHTPFGHSGEEALNAIMADVGGFEHNAQTLRILDLDKHTVVQLMDSRFDREVFRF